MGAVGRPTPVTAPAPAPTFYTVIEVATRLRVSKGTVYQLFRDGMLPGTVRIRRQIRIPEHALDQFNPDSSD